MFPTPPLLVRRSIVAASRELRTYTFTVIVEPAD